MSLFYLFLHEADERIRLFLIVQLCHVHLISHLRPHDLGQTLAHDDAVRVAAEDFLVCVYVAVDITPSRVGTAAPSSSPRRGLKGPEPRRG